jgi:ABC-type uncharacterized transport system substrate-binding protein
VVDVMPLASRDASLDALGQGLRELGYAEGQNLVIEYRSADGRPERCPALAAELVRLGVDVIVTSGTAAALGARHVTDAVPIVMASSGDPVFAGLVASLARPGGNVTGFHGRVPPELAGERLRLLKEVMPGVSRVAVLLDPGDVYAGLDGGGLMAYGTDLRDLFRRSATYVHRILEGARPADLPVEAPARFELAINLTTARALGLAIPPALLRRADRVVR